MAYALIRLGAGQVKIVDIHAGRAEALVLEPRCACRPGTAHCRDRCRRRDRGRGRPRPYDADGHGQISGGGARIPNLISPRQWVSEIVYVPLETELVRVARAKGCRVADGERMAVFQAVHAFELFTGLKADVERMLSALRPVRARLSRRRSIHPVHVADDEDVGGRADQGQHADEGQRAVERAGRRRR